MDTQRICFHRFEFAMLERGGLLPASQGSFWKLVVDFFTFLALQPLDNQILKPPKTTNE